MDSVLNNGRPPGGCAAFTLPTGRAVPLQVRESFVRTGFRQTALECG